MTIESPVGSTIHVRNNDDEYWFPAKRVTILGIENTTAECLAAWIHDQLDRNSVVGPELLFTVIVAETPHNQAIYHD